MTRNDIIRKLTSRKFWVAIVALVSGLLLAFKMDAETVDTISGVIMAIASVIAYTIGEGLVDANGGTDSGVNIYPVIHTEKEKPPDETEAAGCTFEDSF